DIDRRAILATATFVVWDRNDAVDVRIPQMIVEREFSYRRNLQRFMTRAHARRHDEHVIASSNATVWTSIAHERGALVQRKIIWRRSVEVCGKFAKNRHVVRHVVVRDLFSFADTQRGSYRLSKLEHKFARSNVADGKPMTRRNNAVRAVLDYGDVIFRIDDDREVAYLWSLNTRHHSF